jgi:predicted transposase YdaD
VEFNRFDVSAKELVWDDPAAWLDRLGIGPPGPVEVIESQIRMPDGWQTNRYNYRVVRVWAEDPEPYLTAGVNLVPLAPLADVPAEALPGLVRRMAARIDSEPEPRAAKLWTATYLLMGLRYSEELTSQLLEGVQKMQESTTYQAILREGRNEGLIEGRITGEQQLLVRQGTKRFGKPDTKILAAIEAIRDVQRLEALGERILDPDVRDWNSLLGTS